MNQILQTLSEQLLSGPEVAEILGNPEEFPAKKIEEYSIEVALRYWHKELSFEQGDLIMNNLYSFWVTDDKYVLKAGFGEIAWECFEAFDSGEYLREEDNPESDPVELYTKPEIKNLLLRINKINL
jgi:hypothetical protein